MAESKSSINVAVVLVVAVLMIMAFIAVYLFMQKGKITEMPLPEPLPIPPNETAAEKATRIALDSAALFKAKNARTSQNMLDALPERKRKRAKALEEEYKKVASIDISDKEKTRKYRTIQDELKTLGFKIDVNTMKISKA